MARRKQPPTARLRRLAAELRQLRTAGGHTREAVEEKTGINTASLYRIETARVRPQKRTLFALLEFYGVPEGPGRDKLIELTQDTNQLKWLDFGRSELPESYQSFISFESEASRLQNYESLYIPGLLQTEDYTRSLFRGLLPGDNETRVELGVQARALRQEQLARPQPVHLWAVIDEAALRRMVGGPAVMTAQLEHLAHTGRSSSVTLQAMPYAAGAHPGMPGSFVVMEFPDDDPALIYTESSSGGVFLEGEEHVAQYRSTFQHLVTQALNPRQTLDLINGVVNAVQ